MNLPSRVCHSWSVQLKMHGLGPVGESKGFGGLLSVWGVVIISWSSENMSLCPLISMVMYLPLHALVHQVGAAQRRQKGMVHGGMN